MTNTVLKRSAGAKRATNEPMATPKTTGSVPGLEDRHVDGAAHPVSR